MPRVRRATLSDVAARAGVSATTASYILNGRSGEMRIAAATQERVLVAARDLEYRPNPSARNLRMSTTRTIGVISDLVAGGQFASQMLTGASHAARAQGRVIVIAETQGDPELEALVITEMLDRRVDGIVYAKVVTSEVELPTQLQGQLQGPLQGPRTVLLNCVDRTSAYPAVVPDEYAGGRAAAAAVLAGGIREGVHVVGERPTPESIAGALRLSGIRDELRAAGVAVAGETACVWSVPAGFDAVNNMLEAGLGPRALICLNDRIAMGSYQALDAHGLSVPGDVAVVSFDGSDLASWLRPTVTSIAIPYADLGRRAVELLLGEPAPQAGVVRVGMPVHPGGSVLIGGPAS